MKLFLALPGSWHVPLLCSPNCFVVFPFGKLWFGDSPNTRLMKLVRKYVETSGKNVILFLNQHQCLTTNRDSNVLNYDSSSGLLKDHVGRRMRTLATRGHGFHLSHRAQSLLECINHRKNILSWKRPLMDFFQWWIWL